MNNEERLTTKFKEFLSSPPLTEKESHEHDTAYDYIMVKRALIKAMQKIKAQPRTEYLDHQITAYRKQIKEIDAWMAGKDTPTPELDVTIIEELDVEGVDVEELLEGKASHIQPIEEESNNDQQLNHAALPSPSNFFHLENKVWRIRYLGGDTILIPDSKPLREIAERLAHPGVEKDFSSAKEYKEDGEKLQSEPDNAKYSQGVNDKLSPEDRANIEKIVKSSAAKKKQAEEDTQQAKKKELSPEAIDVSAEALDKASKDLDDVKNYVRRYHGNIKNDNSISWGICTDKNIISRQKDAFSLNLRRGVKQIEGSGGIALAKHLEDYLLLDKYYRPPPGGERFYVTT